MPDEARARGIGDADAISLRTDEVPPSYRTKIAADPEKSQLALRRRSGTGRGDGAKQCIV